jgi:hypothetical protein
VPSDLPIPFLIQEIETKFSTKGAFVSSVEKKNGLEFESVISDSSSWKIVFRFYSNDKLHRPVYEIARLLRVAKDAGDDDFTSILSGLDEATLLLPLTKPAAKATSRITGSRCFYLVDLSDMSDEQAFKLDVSFTKKRLDQSLDEIMKNFPALRYVYIRTNSPVHNSTVWPYVRNYLQKKNIIIFTELDVIPFVPVSSAPGAALTSVLEQTRQAGKSIVLSASADKKALQDLTMRAGKFGVALVSLDSIKTNRPKIK